MSININELEVALVRLVRDLVGYRLSSTGSGANQKATAFPARQMPPQPEYPYAVIDSVGIKREGRDIRTKYFDSTTNTETLYFDRTVRMIVMIYCDVDHDCQGILQEFCDRLYTTKGRAARDSRLLPLNANLQNISGINFFPSFKTTDFFEMARVQIDLSVLDIISDSDPIDVIDHIKLDGDLNHYEDDPQPITVTVQAP